MVQKNDRCQKCSMMLISDEDIKDDHTHTLKSYRVFNVSVDIISFFSSLTSYHFALLPSRSPLFPLSSSDLAFLSHFSQHPFLSSLFLPWVAILPLHSFLWKWNLMFFLSHASFHHFSPCLALISIDSHPPWNSFCILFPLWQEPVKPPRSVVAARKRHPTRGNGGIKD